MGEDGNAVGLTALILLVVMVIRGRRWRISVVG